MSSQSYGRRKIKEPGELAEIIAELKRKGKKIVQCHGVYDLMHYGHIHQFEQARKCGDILVVSLTTDQFVNKGPGRPVFNEKIRAETIASLSVVDFVAFSRSESAVDLIKLLKPDFFVKGESYRAHEKDLSGRILLEEAAIKSVDGQLIFTDELPMRSTPLLNTFLDPYPAKVLDYLKEFKEEFPFESVVEAVNSLSNLKVLVIGEVIIDQYDYVEPMDISPKGGVIAVKHLGSELFAGGSLACANHMADFCREITILSYLGDRESHEEFIRNSLAPNIKTDFMVRNGLRTIVKKREVESAYFRKLSETYFFDEASLSEREEKDFLRLLSGKLHDCDLVFVIDYGHGLITPSIRDYLSRSPAFLAVNTQTNSANKGFHVITHYSRADFICLDHFEARLALHDKKSEPSELAQKIKEALKAALVAITLGHNGSLILGREGVYTTPVFSKKVVDTVGAGDAFFSLASLGAVKKLPPSLIGFLGNVTGALATTYLGNKSSVTKNMIFNFAKSLLA